MFIHTSNEYNLKASYFFIYRLSVIALSWEWEFIEKLLGEESFINGLDLGSIILILALELQLHVHCFNR